LETKRNSLQQTQYAPNTTGQLRQYFLKGTDLSQHTQDVLDRAAYSLNTRPRQTLDDMTPSEKLAQVLQ
jgi:IS30 family transposase